MESQLEPLEERPTAVYRLWNQSGRLLYVGMSANPDRRCASHKVTKLWWHEVFRRTEVWFPSRGEAELSEALAIAEESPRYNVIGVEVSEGRGLQIDHHKIKSASLRVPKELREKVKARLDGTGWTMTDLVVAIIGEYAARPRERERELEKFKPPYKRGRPRKQG
ncbi:hypothetical protein GCM10010172_80200 [Paractinoplanes ferrugineus]|uniref:GIY-YIG domain-containing protein n=1 Tax=Paractinoplanes ferrugineus TaxID=113564 RepID=A0A919J8E0_9ACTN|nr:GIY-YIG nuclease family protein [Actinoplanes ferrugineus]GIE16736.1 hypothetical protein Afe05nite_85760 [Actinoplanes ferrugineus]